MRKFNLSIILLTVALLACETQNEPLQDPSIDFHNVVAQFSSMHSQTLDDGKSQKLISVTDQTDEYTRVRLEVDDISRRTGSFLSENFFEGQDPDYHVDLYPALAMYTRIQESNARVTEALSSIIDTTSAFSDAQKEILGPLVSGLLSVDDLSDGYEIVNAANEQIITSMQFTDEEKIELLLISSSAFAMIEFIENDGVADIYNSIQNELGDVDMDNVRVAGCSVDWRTVWGGAVVSMTVGAIGGAIIGCTGGTVILPGIGTAGGCVGGAVFGGAKGFVGGALSAVAGNLLLTCFRGSQTASCKKMLDQNPQNLSPTCLGTFDLR